MKETPLTSVSNRSFPRVNITVCGSVDLWETNGCRERLTSDKVFKAAISYALTKAWSTDSVITG